MAYYAPKFMKTPWTKDGIYQISTANRQIAFNTGNPSGNGEGLMYVAVANIGNQTGPFTITYKNNGAQLKFFAGRQPVSSTPYTQTYEITPSSVTGDANTGYTYTFTIPSNYPYLYITETSAYNLYYYKNAVESCIINSDMPAAWSLPSAYINYYDGTSWSKNKRLRRYNGSGWYVD